MDHVAASGTPVLNVIDLATYKEPLLVDCCTKNAPSVEKGSMKAQKLGGELLHPLKPG